MNTINSMARILLMKRFLTPKTGLPYALIIITYQFSGETKRFLCMPYISIRKIVI
jgi:hypothetical protein